MQLYKSRRMDNSRESKNLKEDSKGSMYIKDVAEIEVKSTEEALELMHKALKRRVIGYTDLNSESSRSHSIFTIRIVQAAYDPSSGDQVLKVNRHLPFFSSFHILIYRYFFCSQNQQFM